MPLDFKGSELAGAGGAAAIGADLSSTTGGGGGGAETDSEGVFSSASGVTLIFFFGLRVRNQRERHSEC